MTLVTEHLERRGLRFEVFPHRRTTTALSEAHTLHADPNEVLKAVVLDIDTGHALAVIPSSHRLDLDLVREALGDPDAALASEDEIARDFGDFELGAIPPMPSLLHIPTVIDPAVFEHVAVTFAAGSQRESVRVSPDALTDGATVVITPITRPPHVR